MVSDARPGRLMTLPRARPRTGSTVLPALLLLQASSVWPPSRSRNPPQGGDGEGDDTRPSVRGLGVGGADAFPPGDGGRVCGNVTDTALLTVGVGSCRALRRRRKRPRGRAGIMEKVQE